MPTKSNRLAPSRECIRLALKERTGAKLVDKVVVDRVVEMLREELARIVEHANRAYEADKDVRKFHRRPSPLLAEHHLPSKEQVPKHRPPDPDV